MAGESACYTLSHSAEKRDAAKFKKQLGLISGASSLSIDKEKKRLAVDFYDSPTENKARAVETICSPGYKTESLESEKKAGWPGI